MALRPRSAVARDADSLSTSRIWACSDLLATGLGIPIPEELPIAIAAMMARWEVMNWWGALLPPERRAGGRHAALRPGRYFGRRILNWPPARRILTPEREKRVMEAYYRHGLKFVVMARLTWGCARPPS
jgi:membrane protein DedA with SNARE-associated domain